MDYYIDLIKGSIQQPKPNNKVLPIPLGAGNGIRDGLLETFNKNLEETKLLASQLQVLKVKSNLLCTTR